MFTYTHTHTSANKTKKRRNTPGLEFDPPQHMACCANPHTEKQDKTRQNKTKQKGAYEIHTRI
jgi:hypothetical protein